MGGKLFGLSVTTIIGVLVAVGIGIYIGRKTGWAGFIGA